MPASRARPPRSGDDRILTVPNLITLVRLACVPLFLWLLFSRKDRWGAALLLAALGSTDWVDGYIARNFDQRSTLGKIIDPAADRILIGVGVAAIMIDRSVPLWIGGLVVARELIVSGAVLSLAFLGARRIDVTWWGKTGTFGLMSAFPMFLGGASEVSIAGALRTLAWIVVIPSLAIAYYAAFGYVPIARRALAEGRAGRAERASRH